MNRSYDFDQALHTVLAALRHYQQCGHGARGALPDAIREIATNGGGSEALGVSEIDALCEDLGFGRLLLQKGGAENPPPAVNAPSCSPHGEDR